MSVVVKEYFGAEAKFFLDVKEFFGDPNNIGYRNNDIIDNSKKGIIVDIEGIHVGLTDNFTYYTEEALKKSVLTWTTPYKKPLIMFHNDRDGIIIGTILNVRYESKNTRSGTGALIFTCEVPDEDAAEKIKDGRLKTVSIGCVSNDVRCSICGKQIGTDDECEHEVGEIYNGQTCYWIMNEISGQELSYVIIPSDKYAHTIKVYSDENEVNKIKEQYKNKGVRIMENAKKSNKEEKIKEQSNTVEKNKEPNNETLNNNKIKIEECFEKLTNELKNVLKEMALNNNSQKENNNTNEENNNVDESKKENFNEDIVNELSEELQNVNQQLKESLVEQIILMREKLNKKEVDRELLMNRTQESLLDTIKDLKEEASDNRNEKKIKEENNNQEINKENNTVEKIEKVVKESLVDEDKNTINKEKKSDINVKESNQYSNNDYEDIEKILNYYIK